MKKPSIFVHIPKTAGTSLLSALKECYTNIAFYYPPNGIDFSAHPHDVELFSGHFALNFPESIFTEQEKTIFTFLREPKARFISQLNYDISYFASSEGVKPEFPPDITSREGMNLYIKKNHIFYLDNCLVRYLSGRWNYVPIGKLTLSDLDLAKRNLERFDFIGDTAHYDSDVANLSSLLGVNLNLYKENTRTNSGDHVPTDGIEIPDDYLDLDRELYAFYLQNYR